MPLISVFTPTYNRADKLHRVFNSLLSQAFTDFEWIIVDDGSGDKTKAIVDSFIQQAPFFPIQYFYQENAGKHIAVNKGVEMSTGQWFYIADSDDALVPNALRVFMNAWNEIPDQDKPTYCGIAACCQDQFGKRVSDLVPAPVYDGNWRDLFYKHAFRKEATNINRLEVMKEYPFPGFKNIYFPEAINWRKMSDKYKIRLIADEIRVYYRENDGKHSIMTSKKKYADKALSACLETSDVLNNDLSYYKYYPSYFVKAALLYHAYKLFLTAPFADKVSLNKNAAIFAAVFAIPARFIYWIFSLRDKKSVANKK